jgi:hypothetical protein
MPMPPVLLLAAWGTFRLVGVRVSPAGVIVGMLAARHVKQRDAARGEQLARWGHPL